MVSFFFAAFAALMYGVSKPAPPGGCSQKLSSYVLMTNGIRPADPALI